VIMEVDTSGDAGWRRLDGFDMVTHMKTTVDISDPLLRQAKEAAAQDGTTLRELIEAGLRHVLKTRRSRKKFRLRDASFQGRGLQREFGGGEWEKIAEAAYEERGG
jgi:hypothetical protein